ILKEDERKEVKRDAAGIETATLSGKTLYFVDRKGYAVLTPDNDVAEQFTKKFTGLDGRLSKETAKKLVESDAALYVDMGAINQKYGDQLKQGAQLIPLILGQIGQGQIDKRTQEAIQGAVEGALQLVDDSRAILIAADFHPEGLAVHAQ